MNTARLSLILAGAAVLAATSPPAVADGATVKLGKRYMAPLYGFSLRPPAGTQRRRERIGTEVVTWTRRDPKTGAIAWSLKVQRSVKQSEKIDLDTYADALAKSLSNKGNFKTKKVGTIKVAGAKAIDLRGTTGKDLGLWQRQVWVLVAPRRFLIFLMTGPADDRGRLNRVLNAVLGTLALSDPEEAWKRRRENTQRAAKFLLALEEKDFRDALDEKPAWFLMRYEGKTVGFLRKKLSPGREKGSDGYELRSHAMFQLPEDRMRLMKRVMFVTPALGMERWKEQLQVGSGRNAMTLAEDGIRQDRLIVCMVDRNGKIDTQKVRAPQKIYLPRALGELLPRIVDLDQRVGYTFAAYSTSTNGFEMRTFTVEGPETFRHGGKAVRGVKATDQVAGDVEPATLHLDRRGRLLKMETPDGLNMVAADRAEVLDAFPRAESVIGAMQKWADQD